MRSRYTAFSLKELDHIEKTHAPEIQSEFNRAEAERMADDCEWHSLEILKSEEADNFAQIDFKVNYTFETKNTVRASSAKFRKDNGEWLYVSTKVISHIKPVQVLKIGRNDPCPCNSGKKSKKCCGTNNEQNKQ
jgi:SEC-C motif-containing protein